ncbi:MAG TPA: hypothetical protein DCP08_06295 [Chloroflexi bacterium]|nr:hypothetical protein [Chloroflexota bacterium]
MATHEERMQILKMIEEGQITAEEGAKLLDALEARGEERAAPARWFRVRVTDMKTGKHKVNINLPLGLLNIGAKIGAKFSAPFDLDIDEIVRAVREGARGKIVDVEDTEDGERVEIYIE